MDDVLQIAIYDGIKRSIRVCIANQCHAAAVALTYSGIDSMACLGMPIGQTDVTRHDFVAWCERYLRIQSAVKVSGLEWYGARCAVLHTYGVRSKLSREGKARMIGYLDRCHPPILFNASASPDLMLVSIEALCDSFFQGVDIFLVDLFADSAKRSVAEQRLDWMLKVKALQSPEDQGTYGVSGQ